MRNPKRIDRVLNTIREIWQKYPDFRLMQLLLNSVPTSIQIDDENSEYGYAYSPTLYNIEDHELESLLEDFYQDNGH